MQQDREPKCEEMEGSGMIMVFLMEYKWRKFWELVFNISKTGLYLIKGSDVLTETGIICRTLDIVRMRRARRKPEGIPANKCRVNTYIILTLYMG